MHRRELLCAGVLLLAACNPATPPPAPGSSAMNAARTTRYSDLLTLFQDWRAFQRPKLVDGVPDYRPGAMAAQHQEAEAYRQRLDAIDPSSWPIDQQADYHVVRAEMNGLDFDHRVLKPWANNPAFYMTVFGSESDQPAREGPLAFGAVELWSYRQPLSRSDATRIEDGLKTVPTLLAQAKSNLVGNGRDLWRMGAVAVKYQSADLGRFIAAVPESEASLRDAAVKAQAATDDYTQWLEGQAPAKSGASGIGVENYDWYLKNVQLVPLAWRDEVTIMERELARSHALLAMEEVRNAGLPQQTVVGSAEEFARRFPAGVTEYMSFLKDHKILDIKDHMDPSLRERLGSFSPGPREFFSEIDYRDPEVMRTHGYHWFDKGRMRTQPHASPIRQVPLLYNIFNTRTEGHATGWEELMLQAGMFDSKPRSRELIYVMLAERAARALGDLRMHSNEWTLEQASEFASKHTPRGWLSLSGNLVRAEQHLYLQQPGYGTSYVIGKIQVEQLIAARKRQQGDKFTMRAFMEEFDAAGLIPMSLIEWQLTGERTAAAERMLAK